MFRILLILCAGLMVLPQAPAANSTIYSTFPYSTVVPISAMTFKPVGLIPLRVAANTLVLSADGRTFYSIDSNSTAKNQVFAIDVATGKTLRVYQTKNPIWFPYPLAVSPNQSQIYVSTCSSSIDGATCEGGNVEVLDVASGLDLAVISMGSDQVFQIAAAPNGAAVYVVHYDNFPYCCAAPYTVLRDQADPVPSGALTAIDVASLQVGASYAAPNYTPWSVVVAPDSRHGYLLDDEYAVGQAIFEIDLAQMTLAATIVPPPTCYFYGGSMAMALSGNGATLAVLGYCGQNDELYFIDTATGTISQTVQGVPAGGIISIGWEGSGAYVWEGNNLDVVNATTGSVTSVLAGLDIWGAVLSSDGQEIYLLFPGGSAVEALEEGYTRISKLFNIGWPPQWLALSPDGNTLYSAYATSANSGLWATSTATGQVTATFPENGKSIYAAAVSPDGETLYVLTYEPNTLMIVNASTGVVENTITLPACENAHAQLAAAIAGPVGNRLYATVCGPTVVINTVTQKIAGVISGTSGPALAVSPMAGVVYVTAANGSAPPNSIDVVDAATNKVTGAIPIGASCIAFSPDGSKAYAVTAQNGVPGVAVIDTSTLAVTGFISGINATGGQSIAVTRDGKLIYVAGSPGVVINARSLAVVGHFQSGGPPWNPAAGSIVVH